MDYNKLKTFITVVDHGSITSAAKSLLRSQSAISQQIQQLELELDIRLLERKSGTFYLSPEGEEIYKYGKTSLEKIDEGLSEVKNAFTSLKGSIRLGVLYNYWDELNLVKILNRFRLKYPGIFFTITEGNSENIENDLINNRIDMGLSIIFKSPRLFIREKIHHSTHSLYASPSFLNKKGKIEDYRNLVNQVLIDTSHDFPCLGPFFKRNAPNLYSSLMHRKPDIVVLNQEIVHQFVLAGHGLAILPDFLVAGNLKRGSIVRLFPHSQSTIGELDVAYRTGRTLKGYEKSFIKELLK